MGLLDSLLKNNSKKDDFQDFVNRYQSGPPSEGYDDDEVSNRFQQVAPELSQQEFEQSAEEAFANMSPQERMEFARVMQQQARSQNLNIPDLNGDGIDDRYQDPRELAQLTSRVQQRDPGLLGGLLGSLSGGMSGGGGGGLGGMLGGGGGSGGLGGMLGGGGGGGLGGMLGGALGGGMGGGRSQSGMGGQGGMGSMMSSPIARAALAGIAAMAVKNMMNRRR